MTAVGSFWIALAVSAGVATLVAVIGGFLTTIGPWYDALRKPAWKPPDWAFGPIWTVILALASLAAALAWQAAPSGDARSWILTVLAINCVLHVFWNIFFFTLRRPDWAFAEVIFLWLSILGLILVLGYYSFWAGVLLVPYIVWVTAAAVLNYDIVRLNRPFGEFNVS